jgi:Carboxypeptidase regulatory-like domain
VATKCQAKIGGDIMAKGLSGERSASNILFGLIVVAALMVVGPSSGWAQTGSGTIRGTVKDPAGAVMANASVTLINPRTNAERKATTSAEGLYVFSSIPPGAYTVKIEAPGFKMTVKTDVVISPAETRGIDIALEIGATNETVTVASLEEIKTETGERSNTIKAGQIENLSIISRNSVELLRILPGVVAPDSSSYERSGFGDAAAYAVNGQRGFNNNISIDGSRVIDIGCNCGSIVSLNNDMVQEVTIKASNYAPEHGNSGVQITGTTKSGGKDFHGSLYGYTRNEALASNDRSRNYVKALDPTSPGGQKQLGRFHYPGFNLSGPVYLPKKVFGPLGGFNQNRDRLFFFVGFEEQRQKFSGDTKQSVVPTLKQRQGDFSEFVGPAGSPDFLGQPVRPFPVRVPGNFFDTSGTDILNHDISPYINPIGRVLIDLYPLPNFNDPNRRFNYIAAPIQSQDRRDFKTRFDYKLSERSSLYVRLTRELEVYDGPYGMWWGPSTYELPTPVVESRLGRSVAVGLTQVLNPSLTNEVVFSGSKLKMDNQYADPEKVSLSALGLDKQLRLPFDNTQFGRQSPYVPLSIVSWSLGQLLSPGVNPLFAHNDSFSITDNLTKVSGSHTIKFGAVLEQANKKNNFQGDPDPQGQFEIDRGLARGVGYEWGNLLVGQLNSVSHGTRVPVGNFRFYNYEFYAQDSWKLRPNFMLEYGMRFSHMTVNQERKGFDILFDPRAYRPGAGYYINGDPFRPNGVLSAARGEIQKGVFDPPAIVWAPRLSFSWDVLRNSNLVLRGGIGIFYNRSRGDFQYDTSLRSAVNGNVGASLNGGRAIPGSGIANGGSGPEDDLSFDDLGGLTLSNMGLITLPNGVQLPIDPLKLANGGGSILSPDPNSRDFPQTYTMSLNIATRLPRQTVLEASYVGTFGRHLPARLPINYVPEGALLRGGGVPGDRGTTFEALKDPNCDRGEARIVNGVVQEIIRRGNCQFETVTQFTDLSNPLHRVALAGESINKFRPFPDLNYVRYQEYTGTSNYHSLQVILSRQTGKNLQFYATYTFSKVLGTTAMEFADLDPLDTRGRSYGVLNFDRTHIFNISYNYNLPNASPSKNAFARGLFNGWQLSGITTFSSGTPLRLRFSGELTGNNLPIAAFGSDAFSNDSNSAGGIAPIFIRDPRMKGNRIGDKLLDLDAIAIPGFGSTGATIAPFYFRTPSTMNWDISLFKNFKISESKNIQFRAGFFNIFNQAFPKIFNNNTASASDINLTLDTRCVRTPVNQTVVLADGTVRFGENGYTQRVPNGNSGSFSGICDPTKPITFSADTISNFGTITNKRGHRVIELALKFTF